MTCAALSPREELVLGMIERAAHSGLPCPKNDEIIGATGQSSTAGVSKIMDGLVRKGRIVVWRGNRSRVVEIVRTGRRTAGVIPKPHWRDRDGSACEARPRHTIRLGSRDLRDDPPVPEAPKVSREPCPMCGTRGDIGCRHQQAGDCNVEKLNAAFASAALGAA